MLLPHLPPPHTWGQGRDLPLAPLRGRRPPHSLLCPPWCKLSGSPGQYQFLYTCLCLVPQPLLATHGLLLSSSSCRVQKWLCCDGLARASGKIPSAVCQLGGYLCCICLVDSLHMKVAQKASLEWVFLTCCPALQAWPCSEGLV